jgi:hypothetical protein
MESITIRLDYLAKDGNLFGAENSFKQLKIDFDAKRAVTLCEIERQLAAPDMPTMRRLMKDLNDELKDISAADEALGKYISESSKLTPHR